MPHPTDIHAGRKVREFRLLRGFTQANVAAELGLSFQQLQKYETASNRMSISRAEEISEYVGFDPALLFRSRDAGATVITEREAELVRIFQNLPNGQQNAVLGFMKSLSQGEAA